MTAFPQECVSKEDGSSRIRVLLKKRLLASVSLQGLLKKIKQVHKATTNCQSGKPEPTDQFLFIRSPCMWL